MGSLFDALIDVIASISPLVVDSVLSQGPLVAFLLCAALLLRELVLLVRGSGAVTKALAAMVVPLLILFIIQVGLVLLY